MRTTSRQALQRFYGQALITPEMMCLHCGLTAWNRADCACTPERMQDCAIFVTDMVNRLGSPTPPVSLFMGSPTPPR
jgi:hypothetical protein